MSMFRLPDTSYFVSSFGQGLWQVVRCRDLVRMCQCEDPTDEIHSPAASLPNNLAANMILTFEKAGCSSYSLVAVKHHNSLRAHGCWRTAGAELGGPGTAVGTGSGLVGQSSTAAL